MIRRLYYKDVENYSENPLSKVAENRLLIELPETLLKKCRGIYFLMKGRSCVYVGQSFNIFQRIQQHISEGSKDFDGAAYIEVGNNNIFKTEAYYIRLLKPKYNYQYRDIQKEDLDEYGDGSIAPYEYVNYVDNINQKV